MPAVYIANNQEFNLSDINENLIALIVTKPDSEFCKKEINLLNGLKEDLNKLSTKVLFVTNEKADTLSPDFILDIDRELINQAEIISSQKSLTEYVIIFSKDGNNLKYLVHKQNPEKDYNWIDIIKQFAINYANTEPDDRGLWRWGQLVQETAEYLCVDCGYILELQAGDVFPVCEVCLSGEPSGPAGPEAGYWEKI